MEQNKKGNLPAQLSVFSAVGMFPIPILFFLTLILYFMGKKNLASLNGSGSGELKFSKYAMIGFVILFILGVGYALLVIS